MPSDRWSAQPQVLNGWQVIGDTNRGKSLGCQIAYASEKLSASFNGIAGSELANNDKEVRALADVVVVYKPIPLLNAGLSVDLAREGRSVGDEAAWGGAGLYLRLSPPESRTAAAARAEYYEDTDGAISGIPQILKEVTATLEHRPTDRLILKLEGRYDRSTSPVFAEDEVGALGNPLRAKDQFLILLGTVATFAR